MSQDRIWGTFWFQNGSQNHAPNDQNSNLGENLIFDTPPTGNQCFWGPRLSPNIPKMRQQKSLRNQTPQKSPIFDSWNPSSPKTGTIAKVLQKWPPREATVKPKCQKVTSKRVLTYSLRPKGSPSSSDSLWRVLFRIIGSSVLMLLGCVFTVFSSCLSLRVPL